MSDKKGYSIIRHECTAFLLTACPSVCCPRCLHPFFQHLAWECNLIQRGSLGSWRCLGQLHQAVHRSLHVRHSYSHRHIHARFVAFNLAQVLSNILDLGIIFTQVDPGSVLSSPKALANHCMSQYRHEGKGCALPCPEPQMQCCTSSIKPSRKRTKFPWRKTFLLSMKVGLGCNAKRYFGNMKEQYIKK